MANIRIKTDVTTRPMETRLIEVAIDLFGRDGMNAVGTRAIAEAAGTQMSAITYHFGGKEALYLACAQHITADMRERIAPLLELARRACTESGGPSEARDAILAMLGGFVGIMMNDDIAPAVRFIVREQMNPTPAFAILFEGGMQPVVERMDQLLQRIARNRLTHDQVRIHAVALVGQVLAFRFARATLMRATGWETVGLPEIDAVRAIVVAHANAILSDLEKGADS
jgi:TetR/AcrR family transcriptional regulator, regulator of cefoperazone and chloramphenicol sensitivity